MQSSLFCTAPLDAGGDDAISAVARIKTRLGACLAAGLAADRTGFRPPASLSQYRARWTWTCCYMASRFRTTADRYRTAHDSNALCFLIPLLQLDPFIVIPKARPGTSVCPAVADQVIRKDITICSSLGQPARMRSFWHTVLFYACSSSLLNMNLDSYKYIVVEGPIGPARPAGQQDRAMHLGAGSCWNSRANPFLENFIGTPALRCRPRCSSCSSASTSCADSRRTTCSIAPPPGCRFPAGQGRHFRQPYPGR